MHRGPRLAIRSVRPAGLLLMVTLLSAWGMAAAAAPPPPPKGSQARSPEVDKAVAELKREYGAFVRNREAAPLRTACNYFKEDAAGTIPPEAVLAALERRMPGDARECAYVKWQLLSALPAEPDAPTVQRLVKVYQRAPVPAPRYGASKQDQRKLDGLLVGAKPEDDVRLNDGLEKLAEQAAATDRAVIAFRDELYRRLPPSREKFLAALQDAHARVTAAADKEKLAEALEADLPGWALQGGTSRAHVREVAELLGKLRFIESPPYYAYASVRSGTLGWRTRNDALLTKAKFATLHKALLDAAGVGPLPESDAADRRTTPQAARKPRS